MTRFAAIAALALCSNFVFAQNATAVEGNINPADIENLPEPTILGPPIGDVQEIETITYDAASVTASVISQATTATPVATDVSLTVDLSSAVATETNTSTPAIEKRSVIIGDDASDGPAQRSSIMINRRSLSYPIDTSNTPTPNGYTPAFESLQGATQANGYLTYKTLKSYDASACAAACNKISSCVFFNIYYERNPDSNNNPIDVIKCSMYLMFQHNTTATNVGQWRGKFHVVITGSNGYNKAATPVAPDGYSLEIYDSAAVNAPLRDSAGRQYVCSHMQGGLP
ncbi:hypothetical protein AAFC00_004329 [Neodothiora populina]|uniref:Uncharacterized protein n=1 Tax=Neodothiora populina TaxID=2781224 RepID=A0ABR3PJD1_9PEZI